MMHFRTIQRVTKKGDTPEGEGSMDNDRALATRGRRLATRWWPKVGRSPCGQVLGGGGQPCILGAYSTRRKEENYPGSEYICSKTSRVYFLVGGKQGSPKVFDSVPSSFAKTRTVVASTSSFDPPSKYFSQIYSTTSIFHVIIINERQS